MLTQTLKTNEGSCSSLTPEISPDSAGPAQAYSAPQKEASCFELSFEPADSIVFALQVSPQQEARHKSDTWAQTKPALACVSVSLLLGGQVSCC